MQEIFEIKDESRMTDLKILWKKLYPVRDAYIEGNEGRLKKIFRLNVPESKVFALQENGQILAHAWLAPNPKLTYAGCKKMGVVGFYESVEDAEISKKILTHALLYAKKIGCDYLVGPMDYSTWNDYRFIQEAVYPPLAMEPYNPPYYPDYFTAFGFKKISSYLSSYTEKQIIDERWQKLKARFDKAGVVISHPDFSDLDLLKKLYPLEKEAWKYQFLYMDIPLEEYLILKAKLPKTLDIENSYLCTHPKYGLCGFIYAYPDNFNPEHQAILLKSIGILPHRDLAGLGVLLTTIFYQNVFKKYKRVIHHLMRSDNFTANYMTDITITAHEFILYGMGI